MKNGMGASLFVCETVFCGERNKHEDNTIRFTKNSTAIYYGEFKDDKFNGEGVLYLPQFGRIHVGEFRKGNIMGKGASYYQESGLRVYGSYEGFNKVSKTSLSQLVYFNDSEKWKILFKKEYPMKKMYLLKSIHFFVSYFYLFHFNSSLADKKLMKNFMNLGGSRSSKSFGKNENDNMLYALQDVMSYVEYLEYLYRNSGLFLPYEKLTFFINKKICNALYSLYKAKYSNKDASFNEKFKKFNLVKFEKKLFEESIKKEFSDCSEETLKELTFAKSLNALREMNLSENVMEKIDHLISFRDCIITDLSFLTSEKEREEKKVKLISADLFTEVVIYLFAKSGIKDNICQYNYMNEWVVANQRKLYSDSKILSVLQFYLGFIGFVEKEYELKLFKLEKEK